MRPYSLLESGLPPVSTPILRSPVLARFYHRYLDEMSIADFVQSVSSVYNIGSLERLSLSGEASARRGAVLALSLLGDEESTSIVGAALRDTDRAVRLIAEDGLLSMMSRFGPLDVRQRLPWVQRLIAAGQFAEAVVHCDQLLAKAPQHAELWFQRGEANRGDGHLAEALGDFERAIECEPYHFHAGLAMADAYHQVGDLSASLRSIQAVLEIHPYLDYARIQVKRLERELRGQTGY